MSDPTPIKPLDWHGFLRILAAHDTQTTLSANTISADALDGVQIDPKRLGALFKAAADAGYIRLVGVENAAREHHRARRPSMTRRTAREMAQDRLATAKRKREAVEARIVRAGAELRAAELALREAEAAEEYAAAHPLLAKPVLAEGVAE